MQRRAVIAVAAAEVKEATDEQGTVIGPTTPEAAARYFGCGPARGGALVRKARFDDGVTDGAVSTGR